MNSSHDIASDLSERAASTPFPPEQLRRVFIPVAFWSHHHTQMKSAWERWGGETEFVTEPARAGECGICIFPKGDPHHEIALHVKPFFDRHGKEANVFEYDPAACAFRRINPEWLATYYPPLAERSWNWKG